ncbi:GL26187 [Drosophila persimilis]|uniref:GL26187 n=1 Tax=Drosophila persimilis TaxID=7234 RepID=B4GKY4_DROPE|nr:GL26187 [Drosophila persimilis]
MEANGGKVTAFAVLFENSECWKGYGYDCDCDYSAFKDVESHTHLRPLPSSVASLM